MGIYRAYGFRRRNQEQGIGLGLVNAPNKRVAERKTEIIAAKSGLTYYGVAPNYGSRKKRR